MTHAELMNLMAALEAKRLDLAAQLSARIRELTVVARALRAIDEDCYGQCMRCDNPIPLKRLQSIPWEPFCMRCREEVEAGGDDGKARDFGEPQAA